MFFLYTEFVLYCKRCGSVRHKVSALDNDKGEGIVLTVRRIRRMDGIVEGKVRYGGNVLYCIV